MKKLDWEEAEMRKDMEGLLNKYCDVYCRDMRKSFEGVKNPPQHTMRCEDLRKKYHLKCDECAPLEARVRLEKDKP